MSTVHEVSMRVTREIEYGARHLSEPEYLEMLEEVKDEVEARIAAAKDMA